MQARANLKRRSSMSNGIMNDITTKKKPIMTTITPRYRLNVSFAYTFKFFTPRSLLPLLVVVKMLVSSAPLPDYENCFS